MNAVSTMSVSMQNPFKTVIHPLEIQDTYIVVGSSFVFARYQSDLVVPPRPTASEQLVTDLKQRITDMVERPLKAYREAHKNVDPVSHHQIVQNSVLTPKKHMFERWSASTTAMITVILSSNPR